MLRTMSWYNYDTDKYEHREMPTDDQSALPYIPPGPRRSLFSLYRDVGRNIPEAMLLALDDEYRKKNGQINS